MQRRKRLPDGSFGPLEKVFSFDTKDEKVEKLEESNALLLYNSMLKDFDIEALREEQAALTHNLMIKGVL